MFVYLFFLHCTVLMEKNHRCHFGVQGELGGRVCQIQNEVLFLYNCLLVLEVSFNISPLFKLEHTKSIFFSLLYFLRMQDLSYKFQFQIWCQRHLSNQMDTDNSVKEPRCITDKTWGACTFKTHAVHFRWGGWLFLDFFFLSSLWFIVDTSVMFGAL